MGGIDANAILVCHCEGSDASTNFVDSSQYARALTANGNAQIDTAQFKFDSSSCLTDGVLDDVTAGDDAKLDVGTGDWTVDFWLRYNSFDGVSVQRFWEWSSYASHGALGQISSTTAQIYINNNPHNWSWTPTTGQWYHVANERFSGTVYFYVDGTALGAGAADSGDMSGGTGGFSFGDSNDLLGTGINGWSDEWRFSDISRYGGVNFTPPTSAYSVSALLGNMMMKGIQ